VIDPDRAHDDRNKICSNGACITAASNLIGFTTLFEHQAPETLPSLGVDLDVTPYMSAPVGGRVSRVGAKIAQGPRSTCCLLLGPARYRTPHDPDVRALLRLAVLHPKKYPPGWLLIARRRILSLRRADG